MDRMATWRSKAADWLKIGFKDMENLTRIGFWGSGIIFLWMGSAYYILRILSSRKPVPGSTPSVSDLATIFFGASSLALIIFSLLVAVAAMIQWQSLKSDVQRATDAAEATLAKVNDATQKNEDRVKGLEEKLQERTNSLEKELRGRVDAVMGATLGTLHSNPTSSTQGEDAKNYISEAIHYAQRGYDRLKELEGNGKYMALNSLVYFSCLLGSYSKRDLLLKQGRELRDIGRKYEDLPYAAPYFMTFCRVALLYSSDLDELKQAQEIGQDLLKTRLTTLQMSEAKYLVASLTGKVERLSGPSS